MDTEQAGLTAHTIKRIDFLGRRVPVLCQNENGPVRVPVFDRGQAVLATVPGTTTAALGVVGAWASAHLYVCSRGFTRHGACP